MKILILGASGMIGNAMFRVLGAYKDFNVWGSIRNKNYLKMFSHQEAKKIVYVEELLKTNLLTKLSDNSKSLIPVLIVL